MSDEPRRQRLEIADVGDITIVNFIDRKILDERNIQIIGEQLWNLVDEMGRRKVVLNFQNVEYFSSAASGKLITLNKKLFAAGGKLVMCGFHPEICEVFETNKLNRLFYITATEEQAMAFFLKVPLKVPLWSICPIHGCGGRSQAQDQEQKYPLRSFTMTCLDCGAQARIRGDLPLGTTLEECRLLGFTIPTYDSEQIECDLNAQFSTEYYQFQFQFTSLKVIGRLDLYASEALERALYTLPIPRKLLVDLQAATEVSTHAIPLLLRLRVAEKDGQAVLLIDKTKAEQVAAFGEKSGVFADRAAASVAVGSLFYKAKPVTVKVGRQD